MTTRHDWTADEVQAFFALPFNDLLFRAHAIHRAHHDPNAVQVSTLLSVKTGACPEDCGYCSQSARHATGVEPERLMSLDEVTAAARSAREGGATRFCMSAAWRSPTGRQLGQVAEMVQAVKGLGMETCMTLGMLSAEQAQVLKEAGLDYYNHNLDTSPEYYERVVTTRRYADRLSTLANVREAGIHICSGGIVGMGESREDRAELLRKLACLPRHPESVPLNALVRIPGTPLAATEALDPLEFVRTVAVARILMPRSFVRLSAGRAQMSDEIQALCFFAGANSVFFGERLLTTPNPAETRDRALFRRLGLRPLETEAAAETCGCGGSG